MSRRRSTCRGLAAAAVLTGSLFVTPSGPAGALTVGTTESFTVGGVGHDGNTVGITCVPAVGAVPAGCVAVGTNEGTQRPLVITSDGTTHVASYADAFGGRHNLNDVFCSTSVRCIAVGWGDPSSTSGLPYLLELENGTWSPISLTPPDIKTSVGDARLLDISCFDIDNCLAVGSYRRLSDDRFVPFVVTKVAGTWSTQQVVPPASTSSNGLWFSGDRLETLACPSTTTCIAVGVAYSGSLRYPIISMGTLSAGTWAWTTSAAPLPDLTDGRSIVVNCTVGGYCLAAGLYTASSAPTSRSFALEYSNGAWSGSLISFDDAGAAISVSDVSCPVTGICYLAGWTGSNAHAVVVEFVDGTPTVVNLDKGANGNYLTEIECPTMNSCAVAGAADDAAGGMGANMYIATRENGSWTISPSYVLIDAPNANDSRPAALSCRTDGFCMAGGQHRHTNVWWRASVTPFSFPIDPSTRTSGGGNGDAGDGGGSGSGNGSTVIPPAYTG